MNQACPQCAFPFVEGQQEAFSFCPKCSFPLLRVAGKYRLTRLLGEGSFGRVYLARHMNLRHKPERVIKVMRSDVLRQHGMEERFWREVQLTAALSEQNAHVVRVYDDFGEEEGLGFYYVMEYLRGRSLKEVCRACGPLPLPLVWHIFRQLCEAVALAHSEDIIHRDLKPQNIYLIPRGRDPYFVKIFDFGIAKSLAEAKPADWTRGALGTPAYMAPEQCSNRHIDQRTDLYAMGVILYEMLSGRSPFTFEGVAQGTSPDPMAILIAHMTQAPVPLSEQAPWLAISPELDQVILKSLAKDADDRYESAEAFWQVLLQHLSSDIFQQPLPTPRELLGAQTTVFSSDAWASVDALEDPDLLTPVPSSSALWGMPPAALEKQTEAAEASDEYAYPSSAISEAHKSASAAPAPWPERTLDLGGILTLRKEQQTLALGEGDLFDDPEGLVEDEVSLVELVDEDTPDPRRLVETLNLKGSLELGIEEDQRPSSLTQPLPKPKASSLWVDDAAPSIDDSTQALSSQELSTVPPSKEDHTIEHQAFSAESFRPSRAPVESIKIPPLFLEESPQRAQGPVPQTTMEIPRDKAPVFLDADASSREEAVLEASDQAPKAQPSTEEIQTPSFHEEDDEAPVLLEEEPFVLEEHHRSKSTLSADALNASPQEALSPTDSPKTPQIEEIPVLLEEEPPLLLDAPPPSPHEAVTVAIPNPLVPKKENKVFSPGTPDPSSAALSSPKTPTLSGLFANPPDIPDNSFLNELDLLLNSLGSPPQKETPAVEKPASLEAKKAQLTDKPAEPSVEIVLGQDDLILEQTGEHPPVAVKVKAPSSHAAKLSNDATREISVPLSLSEEATQDWKDTLDSRELDAASQAKIAQLLHSTSESPEPTMDINADDLAEMEQEHLLEEASSVAPDVRLFEQTREQKAFSEEIRSTSEEIETLEPIGEDDEVEEEHLVPLKVKDAVEDVVEELEPIEEVEELDAPELIEEDALQEEDSLEEVEDLDESDKIDIVTDPAANATHTDLVFDQKATLEWSLASLEGKIEQKEPADATPSESSKPPTSAFSPATEPFSLLSFLGTPDASKGAPLDLSSEEEDDELPPPPASDIDISQFTDTEEADAETIRKALLRTLPPNTPLTSSTFQALFEEAQATKDKESKAPSTEKTSSKTSDAPTSTDLPSLFVGEEQESPSGSFLHTIRDSQEIEAIHIPESTDALEAHESTDEPALLDDEEDDALEAPSSSSASQGARGAFAMLLDEAHKTEALIEATFGPSDKSASKKESAASSDSSATKEAEEAEQKPPSVRSAFSIEAVSPQEMESLRATPAPKMTEEARIAAALLQESETEGLLTEDALPLSSESVADVEAPTNGKKGPVRLSPMSLLVDENAVFEAEAAAKRKRFFILGGAISLSVVMIFLALMMFLRDDRTPNKQVLSRQPAIAAPNTPEPPRSTTVGRATPPSPIELRETPRPRPPEDIRPLPIASVTPLATSPEKAPEKKAPIPAKRLAVRVEPPAPARVVEPPAPRRERIAPARVRPRKRARVAALTASGGRCPHGMVWIEAGSFRMGSAVSDPMHFFGEKQLVRTRTSAYCIDRYEAPGKGKMPSRGVSWSDAKRRCRAQGKRLCTESEWERACKGSSGRRYPYGNSFNPSACNTRDAGGKNRSLRRTGSYSRCRSSFGVFDMSGNVAEWTSSPFRRKGWRIIRGGSFNRPDWDVRCASRGGLPPSSRKPSVGFRCCADTK
ncbi:MAG: SUMF1/EgtB/PvdO family nonheme iron enzyme [Myxococcales bacterium]|nr:SUMF1/EgtB/PvdO family nonheme iron enzyme [Myxococcales bacterium]